MKRTHYCGQLTKEHIGKKVNLFGWIHSRRDHGKLIFVDLRDREGLVQVVFLPKPVELAAEAEKLRSEYVVNIEGTVQLRPKGTENLKIKTGEIEVLAEKLEILNTSKVTPFEISDYIEASEEIRLRYRYLDLRRTKLKENLILRNKVIKILRDFLYDNGFIDLETPMLTKSTPEGARDFLVPSRLNPGTFYALPQSPQLFKQILMISGFDKYFQIVKCFRDEDLRSDRQPEFTQLDMEMSFIDENDIQELIEKMIYNLFTQLGIEIQIPFQRMKYNDAILNYGTDKPDLRTDKKEYKFLWIVDFPLFEYSEEEKRLVAKHHPFTSPVVEDIVLLDSEPLKVRARAYDLILNGVEIGGGSIRIHKRELQDKIFKILTLSEEYIEERFGFLLEALEYGAPPHGGIALGMDRLIAILSGEDTIRDVIAFPKTQKGFCLLTGAPDTVSEKQLKELNIRTVQIDKK